MLPCLTTIVTMYYQAKWGIQERKLASEVAQYQDQSAPVLRMH
jgi:hypothetical protein